MLMNKRKTISRVCDFVTVSFPAFASLRLVSALSTSFLFSRASHRLRVFPRLSLVACFPALVTCCFFFPRLSLVACFPAPVTCCFFSRALHWSHVFPRFSLATCFPALYTGYIFSRAFRWFTCFPALVSDHGAFHCYMFLLSRF